MKVKEDFMEDMLDRWRHTLEHRFLRDEYPNYNKNVESLLKYEFENAWGLCEMYTKLTSPLDN